MFTVVKLIDSKIIMFQLQTLLPYVDNYHTINIDVVIDSWYIFTVLCTVKSKSGTKLRGVGNTTRFYVRYPNQTDPQPP